MCVGDIEEDDEQLGEADKYLGDKEGHHEVADIDGAEEVEDLCRATGEADQDQLVVCHEFQSAPERGEDDGKESGPEHAGVEYP